ncbi:DUF308 domain-containing protein [Acidisoma silvae]|uniref:DUF308 domain-containing protein n=1 Tax=Acidisoma silvae TaxID=2802396 RepID=A0A963YT39_9PROT|nr:DUF308 domain-containing protein [Acidisoma silvae]MCB8876027.1 DUF308 domain-containing protein [Acidisoma silvae]
MPTETVKTQAATAPASWLKTYYFLRFAISALWVALAFTLAKTMPPIAAVMLVAYPAWDALANVIDAGRSGGLRRNPSQMLNVAVSLLTAIAVVVALGRGISSVITVFGVWAALSGLFQLLTGARRWKTAGAQWAMILSGAQSALAGFFFVKMAHGTAPLGIVTVAPYAAFGAFYFLVSALWLVVSDARRKTALSS